MTFEMLMELFVRCLRQLGNETRIMPCIRSGMEGPCSLSDPRPPLLSGSHWSSSCRSSQVRHGNHVPSLGASEVMAEANSTWRPIGHRVSHQFMFQVGITFCCVNYLQGSCGQKVVKYQAKEHLVLTQCKNNLSLKVIIFGFLNLILEI